MSKRILPAWAWKIKRSQWDFGWLLVNSRWLVVISQWAVVSLSQETPLWTSFADIVLLIFFIRMKFGNSCKRQWATRRLRISMQSSQSMGSGLLIARDPFVHVFRRHRLVDFLHQNDIWQLMKMTKSNTMFDLTKNFCNSQETTSHPTIFANTN